MLLLKNVWKEYPIKDNEPVQALKGVSLAFKDRGLTCILGPSGCGKTTLLNIIGGLDHYTSGDVIVNGCSTKDYRDRDWDSYRNREVGIVFQSYNLIPHLSILKNVELAMTLSGVRSREREERAKKALTLVGLLDQCEKKPNQLSGGQMQRVALARALVNTPNVILADEPTGALDSTTSVQVMELFKEISQKRLVIMVTHNESLAERYADRIIRLEDGKVVSDSIDDPEKSLREAEEEIGNILAKRPPEKKRNAFLRFFDDHFKRDRDHTSMNLQTALSISGRNLLAKRGKTIVTAIASSIGIIGVGLVLALSNGFTNYVDRMERETLSKFPMSIEKYGLNYASSSGDHLESYPEGDVVNVVEPSTSSLHTNRITKEYIQYLEGLNTEETTYAQYHYSYSIGMHVIGKGSSNLGVETYQAISTSSSSFVESMASSLMGSSSAWNELPASQEQILEQYDILAGEFPDEELQVAEGGVPDQEEFGLVLVLDSRNSLTTTTLSQLGIGKDAGAYRYEDFLGTEFRYIPSEAYYGDPIPETEFDSESGTFVPVYRNGFFFKDDVTMDEIVQQMQQMMQDDGESDLSTFLDMLDLPTAQEIQDHADELLLDSNVQAVLSKYQVSTLDLIQLLTKVLGEGSFTKEDLQSLFPDIASPSEQERVGNFLYDLIIAIRDSSLFAPYFHRQLNYYQSPANDSNRLKELYEGTDQGQRTLKISCILRPKSTTSIGLLGEGIYYPSSLTYQCFHDNASSSIAEEFKQHILLAADQTKNYGELFGELVSHFWDDTLDIQQSLSSILSNFSLLTLTVIDDVTPYSTTSDISEYMGARLELGSDVLFEEGVDFFDPLTYSDFVSSITIYPTSYDNKLYLIEKMNEYNEGLPEADRVVYTDVGGMATDMVGEIVQVISAVLIAFASISLVVSAVMISIIIYSSVVERTKEIGVLRSIGARKMDVGRLFKAEAIIIGLLAGLFGIVCTYLFSLVISALLNNAFPTVSLGQICFLNPLHALLLIVVSVFLTYLASLIPARIAAKKDPVTCLRSE